MKTKIRNLIIIAILYTTNTFTTPFYNQFNFDEYKSFMQNFIGQDDLVFDVGANIGNKAEVYLACGASVVCFEPQPECVNKLKQKFGNNANVHIEQKGLASETGSLELFCGAHHTISSFSKEWVESGRFAVRNYKWNKKIKVEVETLDNMIEKYGTPKFCKIDVENFEYDVLLGLSKPIEYINFECNYEKIENTEKCLDYLSIMGYNKFNFAIGERGWFAFEGWLTREEFTVELEKLSKSKDWSSIWGLWGDVFAKYE